MATEEGQEAITINIGNISDGALVEAFQVELGKVLQNIMDPNTPPTAKREINLRLIFKPKDDRIQINTQFTVHTKLASIMPSVSRIFVGKDANGALYGLDEDPRQLSIFSPPAPKEVAAPIPFTAKA